MKGDCFWWIVFGFAAYPKMDKKRSEMAKMGKLRPKMFKMRPKMRPKMAKMVNMYIEPG